MRRELASLVAAAAALAAASCQCRRYTGPASPVVARAAGGDPTDPEAWTAQPPPQPEGADYRCAQVSGDRWVVSLLEGEARAALAPDVAETVTPAVAERVRADEIAGARLLAGGKALVATRNRESGGELWLLDPETGAGETLTSGQFTGIFPTAFGLFVGRLGGGPEGTQAASGARRPGEEGEMPPGELVEVRNCDGWNTRLFAQLPAPPAAFHGENNSTALVVTPIHLLRLDAFGEVQVLYRPQTPWVNPTSMTVDRYNRIWIGAQHAVIRLTPHSKGYEEEWLWPAYCEAPVVDGLRCTCQ